jgi:hypothetical protein
MIARIGDESIDPMSCYKKFGSLHSLPKCLGSFILVNISFARHFLNGSDSVLWSCVVCI